MSYSNSTWDNAHLLKRTLLGITDISGRSRRTEMAYYWIATALISVVLNFAVGTVVSFDASLAFGNTIQILLMVPMFALFVRRIHDQDRSGWWGLLLPMAVLLSIPQRIAELSGDIHSVIAEKSTPLAIASGLCGLAVFALCVLPGTVGANNYGSDPRLEE